MILAKMSPISLAAVILLMGPSPSSAVAQNTETSSLSSSAAEPKSLSKTGIKTINVGNLVMQLQYGSSQQSRLDAIEKLSQLPRLGAYEHEVLWRASQLDSSVQVRRTAATVCKIFRPDSRVLASSQRSAVSSQRPAVSSQRSTDRIRTVRQDRRASIEPVASRDVIKKKETPKRPSWSLFEWLANSSRPVVKKSAPPSKDGILDQKLSEMIKLVKTPKNPRKRLDSKETDSSRTSDLEYIAFSATEKLSKDLVQTPAEEKSPSKSTGQLEIRKDEVETQKTKTSSEAESPESSTEKKKGFWRAVQDAGWFPPAKRMTKPSKPRAATKTTKRDRAPVPAQDRTNSKVRQMIDAMLSSSQTPASPQVSQVESPKVEPSDSKKNGNTRFASFFAKNPRQQPKTKKNQVVSVVKTDDRMDPKQRRKQALDMLAEARALLAKDRLEEAEELTQKVQDMAVDFGHFDDTPRAVQKDISGARFRRNATVW